MRKTRLLNIVKGKEEGKKKIPLVWMFVPSSSLDLSMADKNRECCVTIM